LFSLTGEDPKSSYSGFSDEDESVSTDANSSIATCISQINVHQYDHTSYMPSLSDQYQSLSSSSLSIDNSKSKIQRTPAKKSSSRRRGYNLALPPVAEHVNDDETGDELH
jgi:hypothetical protein